MTYDMKQQLRDLANCRHDDLSICYEAADRIEQLETERDQLRKDVTLLLDYIIRCREWFETQAKVKSKGGPSSWELMLLRDERDAADEVLAKVRKP